MEGLKDYILLEKLGSGSFGTVWKALRRTDGAMVAVKMIDLEESEEDIMELQREIAFLQSCDKAYVTQYHECFVAGAQLCIVMELMEGGSVLDIAGMPGLTEGHIALICKQSLAGLAYLHAQGRIHRDIKAANILIDRAGVCKLADFGVAAQVSSQRSRRHTFVGTPFWMAPEVIEQAGYDSRADIWSLGITAIELAMGQPPLTHLHPMRAIFHIPKNPAPRLTDAYSETFRDFVAQCLQKDPMERPFARDLRQHPFLRQAIAELELARLTATVRLRETTADAQATIIAPRENAGWQFDTRRGGTITARGPGSIDTTGDQTVRGDPRGHGANGTDTQRRPHRSSWEQSWPQGPSDDAHIEYTTSGDSFVLSPGAGANSTQPPPENGDPRTKMFLKATQSTQPILSRFMDSAEELRKVDEKVLHAALEHLCRDLELSGPGSNHGPSLNQGPHVADTSAPADTSEPTAASPISQLLYTRWVQEIQRRWKIG